MPFNATAGEDLLREKLIAIVLESGLTYKETMSALNYVICVLRDKGGNLLDGVNIQKVAKQKRFSRRNL